MKLPKLKKFEPIEVVWIDSLMATSRTWFTLSLAEDWIDKKSYCKQIGYFVKYNDDFIVMCGGFSALQENQQMLELTAINTIPKGCIKSIKKL